MSALYATELFDSLLLFQKPIRVNLNSSSCKSIPYPIVKRIVPQNKLPLYVRNPKYGNSVIIRDHTFSSTPGPPDNATTGYPVGSPSSSNYVEPYDPANPSAETANFTNRRRYRDDDVRYRRDEVDFDTMLEEADRRHSDETSIGRGYNHQENEVDIRLRESGNSKRFYTHQQNYGSDDRPDLPSRNYRFNRESSPRSNPDGFHEPNQFYHKPIRKEEYYDSRYRSHQPSDYDNHRHRSYNEERVNRPRNDYDTYGRSHRQSNREYYARDREDRYMDTHDNDRNYRDRYSSQYSYGEWNRDRRQDMRPDKRYEEDYPRSEDRKRFKPYG